MDSGETPVGPLRSSALETHAAGDDLLVHDKRHAKVHVLNRTAAEVFSICDGAHDVDAIVDTIARGAGVAPERVRSDVTLVLSDFRERGLLEDARDV